MIAMDMMVAEAFETRRNNPETAGNAVTSS